MNEEIKKQIAQLKKERDAVILAHYYVDGEVQEIADFVGILISWRKRQRKFFPVSLFFAVCLLWEKVQKY